MKTKKQLRNRIKFLEDALATFERRNVLIDNSKLPKCKSLACANCKNAVFHYSNYSITLLGCGKDKVCEGYTPLNVPTQERALQLVQDALLFE